MKITLRYQRLEKPRGNWPFKLLYSLDIGYTDEERASLNPTWGACSHISDAVPDCFYECRTEEGKRPKFMESRQCPHCRDNNAYCIAVTFQDGDTGWRGNPHTLCWPEPRHRERFIVLLEELKLNCQSAAVAFWNAYPPIDGDASHTVLEWDFDRDSGVEGAVVAPRKRVVDSGARVDAPAKCRVCGGPMLKEQELRQGECNLCFIPF